jgi:hypothetical protein
LAFSDGEVEMFRVVGHDARGHRRDFSVNAATEEEARAMALSSGDIAVIDEATVPPPLPPRRTVRLCGWTVTIIGCLLCVGLTAAGAGLGGLLGHELDASSSDFIKSYWLLGGTVGAILGLICGVSILVAFLKRFWNPR